MSLSFEHYSRVLFDSCRSCFGESVTYYPKDSEQTAGIQISGIFTKQYKLIEEGGFHTELSSSHPVFELSDEELPFKPKQGDQLQIRGVLYRVVEVQPNYEGQTQLNLKKTH